MGTAELMIIGRTLPYTLRNNFSSLKQFHAPLDLKYYYLKLAVSYRKPVSVLVGQDESYIIICCPRSNNTVFPEVKLVLGSVRYTEVFILLLHGCDHSGYNFNLS